MTSTRADTNGFMGTRAGVVTRTMAAGIDLATILVVVLSLYFAISGVIFVISPRRFEFPQFSPLVLFTVGEVMLFLYLAVGWMNTGRSVGKQLLGLRVVESNGGRVRPARALLRAAFATLLPVSLFWSAIDKKNRAVHDALFGTVVVYDWSLRAVMPLPVDGAAQDKMIDAAAPGPVATDEVLRST